MFTGLIEEIGKVSFLSRKGGQGRIIIQAERIPAALQTGDSVAVSGVCLTAVDLKRSQFSADLAEETLQRTSLGSLQKNSCVNLELPTRAQDRLGGHVVQGHVDGVGKLVSLERIKNNENWRLVIDLPDGIDRYVVPQGSITVEGISLTVAKISGNAIEIAVIPHTYKVTNLNTLRVGSPLNIEVDVLAKYAEKARPAPSKTSLTLADLVRKGF